MEMKTPYDEKTFYQSHQVIEEDEKARIQEIFKGFDTSNRGRAPISDLPTILRLLNKNISEHDILDLQFIIDKKNRGYFLFSELIQLLSDYQFKEDKEDDLLNALRELDHDADGFIHKDEFSQMLTSMGEVFSHDEIREFLKYALDEKSDGLIDIKRLSKVLLPVIEARSELLMQSMSASQHSIKEEQ